jgi:transcriptional regulator with XRE-family HTH domain
LTRRAKSATVWARRIDAETAMLDDAAAQPRVSTGLAPLDAVLGELFWGDNVVWDLDGATPHPFYAAIAGLEDAFDTRTLVRIDGAADADLPTGVEIVGAGPGTGLPDPADLLREIQRRCQVPGRRLLLFSSLDNMIGAWGANSTRGLFARCCPLLLEAGAIAYWAMSVRQTPATVRDTVAAVTQCILRVDERSVRVTKAEGRDDRVVGSVLHWHEDDGFPVLEEASIAGRVAASLRALRRARSLSQQELAELAGVTSSAISQAERAERGLSLTTLARLSTAIGITIDDLLRGEDPDLYKIGRRLEDPQHGPEHAITLVGSADSDLRVDFIQLAPRESGSPMLAQEGSGIVAVSSGLVQVRVGGQTPAVRHGEVLVADSERVEQWRNVGHGDAQLFWIVLSQLSAARPHRSIT